MVMLFVVELIKKLIATLATVPLMAPVGASCISDSAGNADNDAADTAGQDEVADDPVGDPASDDRSSLRTRSLRSSHLR